MKSILMSHVKVIKLVENIFYDIMQYLRKYVRFLNDLPDIALSYWGDHFRVLNNKKWSKT